MGWRAVTLGEVCQQGAARARPAEVLTLPTLGLEHIGAGTLALLGLGEPEAMATPGQRVEPGDIVFGRLRPAFRKVIRAPEALVCTPEAWVLRAREGVDPAFLFYLVASPEFVEACARSGEGTRMPRASWSAAAAFRFALPPLPEQREIGAFLTDLDARSALDRAQCQTLEGLSRAAFEGRFSPAGVAPASALRSPGSRRGTLEELALRVHASVSPQSVPAALPYVGLEHLPRRASTLEAWGRADEVESKKTGFCAGDTLFGRLRPALHKVALAPVDGVASEDILVLRPSAPERGALLHALLSSVALVALATAAAEGTRMPRVSWSALRRLPVEVPSEAEARRFEAEVGPLYARLRANVLSLRARMSLRDSLLAPLLEGRLRMPPPGVGPAPGLRGPAGRGSALPASSRG